VSGETLSLIRNDEQRMLSRTSRELVRSRAPVKRLRAFRDADDALGFSRELWSEMAELGWLGLQIPESLGGLGLGFFDLCVLLEESGRELLPEPFTSTILLGTQALLLGGTEKQRKALLPGVVRGETLLALAHEERGLRADLSRIETRAEAKGDGYEISGDKVQVLDGHAADSLIVSARTGRDGQTLFLVDASSPGVKRTRQRRLDAHGSALVRFDGVRVGVDAVVGEMNEGLDLLRRVLDRACVGLAAQMLGGAERAFERTLDYLKERVQFDVPIGSFQALQHRAVDLYTELVLTRSAVLAAARAVDEAPDQVPRLATLAKAIASETFLEVAKEAIQMHGGIGVTDEHDIGLYLKRAQATYMMFGQPSKHRRRWAEIRGY